MFSVPAPRGRCFLSENICISNSNTRVSFENCSGIFSKKVPRFFQKDAHDFFFIHRAKIQRKKEVAKVFCHLLLINYY